MEVHEFLYFLLFRNHLFFDSVKVFINSIIYNTPRFSDRHNYGGMTRNRYICKKEENQNGKTI